MNVLAENPFQTPDQPSGRTFIGTLRIRYCRMRVSYRKAASWLLAAVLLSVVAVSLGTVVLPASVGTRMGILLLPVALGLSIWTRAIGRDRESTDLVLALFSLPAVFVSLWSIYEALFTAQRGFVGLVALAAGALLAVAVLADGVIERIVVPNGSSRVDRADDGS